MKEVAGKELLNVSRDHHAYKRLIKDLIVQVCFENSKWRYTLLISFALTLLLVLLRPQPDLSSTAPDRPRADMATK